MLSALGGLVGHIKIGHDCRDSSRRGPAGASIMSSNSMMLSLGMTRALDDKDVFASDIFVSSTVISPSENFATAALPIPRYRRSATLRASAGLAFPVNTIILDDIRYLEQ